MLSTSANTSTFFGFILWLVAVFIILAIGNQLIKESKKIPGMYEYVFDREDWKTAIIVALVVMLLIEIWPHL